MVCFRFSQIQAGPSRFKDSRIELAFVDLYDFVQGLISHDSMTGSEAKPKQGHTDIPDTLDKAVNKQQWRLQHTQHLEKFF